MKYSKMNRAKGNLYDDTITILVKVTEFSNCQLTDKFLNPYVPF